MATLKFEIDTDDLYQYEDGPDFTDLVRGAIGDSVKKEIVKSRMGDKIPAASKIIALESIHQVEKKLASLINEDLAIPDRWGKPVFIGSVEDYMKKQIDEKLFRHVDSSGKTLTGACSNSEDTWLEWKVGRTIEAQLKRAMQDVERLATRFCNEELDRRVENFKAKTLTGLIIKKLESVGVK